MTKNFTKLKALSRNTKKRCHKDSNNRYRIFMFYRNCTNKKINQSAICGEVIGGELDPFPVQYSPLFQVIYHSMSQSEFRANTHKHSEN